MLVFDPIRRPHQVGSDLVSFGDLRNHRFWPQPVAKALLDRVLSTDKSALAELPSPLRDALIKQGVLVESTTPTRPTVYPLKEIRAQGWTNSDRGARLLTQLGTPMTILDALSFDDLKAIDPELPLLYTGDSKGGFFISPTRPDHLGACPRCCVLRYLAGRQAHPILYRALASGARVSFERPPCDEHLKSFLEDQTALGVFGQGSNQPLSVFSLPDCRICAERPLPQTLTHGLFSPIRSLTSSGPNHRAKLGELIWVSGHESVGHGASWDLDPKRGRQRALNEAIERYAAHFYPPDTSTDRVEFFSPQGSRHFSRRRALLTEPGSISTGLSCREQIELAIADGLREVCERDALAAFWLALDQQRARVVHLDTLTVQGLKVERYLLDSHHLPTVLAIGRTESGNIATGSACNTIDEALDKATEECLQNANSLSLNKRTPTDPPESFEDHCLLYWREPQRFPNLGDSLVDELDSRPLPGPIYHRELTPKDLSGVGLFAVRVIVEGVLYLPMAHRDWPQVLIDTGREDLSTPRSPHPFA